jgi:hypothetical protein
VAGVGNNGPVLALNGVEFEHQGEPRLASWLYVWLRWTELAVLWPDQRLRIRRAKGVVLPDIPSRACELRDRLVVRALRQALRRGAVLEVRFVNELWIVTSLFASISLLTTVLGLVARFGTGRHDVREFVVLTCLCLVITAICAAIAMRMNVRLIRVHHDEGEFLLRGGRTARIPWGDVGVTQSALCRLVEGSPAQFHVQGHLFREVAAALRLKEAESRPPPSPRLVGLRLLIVSIVLALIMAAVWEHYSLANYTSWTTSRAFAISFVLGAMWAAFPLLAEPLYRRLLEKIQIWVERKEGSPPPVQLYSRAAPLPFNTEPT